MTEKFVKENDYAISVIFESAEKGPSYISYDSEKWHSASVLTRTFNFMSAQIVTVKTERILVKDKTASVATQMQVESFYDIPYAGEIKLMHAKLREMGGKPPALEEVLGGLNKQRLPLTPKGG